MIIWRSMLRRSSGSDRPSCFSAAWNCSSLSSLFSLRMLATICANCSSDSAKPSSLPRCRSNSSSIASTMICGVTSLSAARSSSSAFGSVGFGALLAWRTAATCRCSRSVLVKISPFTFTSTCSMISARSETVRASARAAAPATPRARRIVIGMIRVSRRSYAKSESSVRTARTWSNSLSGLSNGVFLGLTSSSRVNPGATVPLVARSVHHDIGFCSGFRPILLFPGGSGRS